MSLKQGFKGILFAFVVALPLTDMTRWYIGYGSLAELLLIPISMGAAIHLAGDQYFSKRSKAQTSIVWLVVVWGIFAALSWAFTGSERQLIELTRLAEYLVAFASFFILGRYTEYFKTIHRAIPIAALLGAGIVIIHLLVGPENDWFQNWAMKDDGWYYTSANFRAHGSFGNPLNAVMMLGSFLGFIWAARSGYMSLDSKKVYILMFLLAIALVGTGSKTVVIIVLALVLVGRSFKLTAFLLITASVILYFEIGSIFLSRISSTGMEDMSVINRVQVLLSSFEMIKEYPLLGVGIGEYEDVYWAYRTSFASSAASTFTAENIFVQQLVEVGIIGGLAFAGAILVPVKKGFGIVNRNDVKAYPFIVALIIFSVSGMVQSAGSADLNLYLMMLLGIVASNRN